MRHPLQQLQRKRPTKRMHTGLAGSPLAKVEDLNESKMKPVLVHRCFNQLENETKPIRCNCKEHWSFDCAAELVKSECADWLLVQKPGKKPFQSKRAIVLRQVRLGGEVLFAVSPPSGRREKKYERIKAAIFSDARRILEKLVIKGLISPHYVNPPNENLIELFEETSEHKHFIERLEELGQMKFRKAFISLCVRYWSNLLGYKRLSPEEGTFIGSTQPVKAGDKYDIEQIAAATEKMGNLTATYREAAQETIDDDDVDKYEPLLMGVGRRGGPEGYKPSFWCRGWDFSQGADPNVAEREESDGC